MNRLPIDIYDSATPEPGYEDMTITEVCDLIDEQWAEIRYDRLQDYRQSMHDEWLNSIEGGY